jgi:hypothetical protein
MELSPARLATLTTLVRPLLAGEGARARFPLPEAFCDVVVELLDTRKGKAHVRLDWPYADGGLDARVELILRHDGPTVEAGVVPVRGRNALGWTLRAARLEDLEPVVVYPGHGKLLRELLACQIDATRPKVRGVAPEVSTPAGPLHLG